MPRVAMQWSVLRYDLKTALDILGLPCHVQVADDQLTTNDSRLSRQLRENGGDIGAVDTGSSLPNIIRIEKKICTCYVRARVLDIDDVEWFIFKKGVDYYKQHSKFVNKEILIALDCSSKVRLKDKGGGKIYTTIREIAADFPRFIRAEQDTVCVSPGSTSCQIVTKGTILELDRVTQENKAVRGFRENFLICVETETSRELAFRLMSTCRFSKVLDTTSYCLKDLIERLPLPQTVDFLVTNPYDVISVSDVDAADLLTMLSGPLELKCFKMQEYLVGHIHGSETVVAFPFDEELFENVLVNMPVSRTGSVRDPVDPVSDTIDYEAVMDKLYLLCADSQTVLRLRASCFERDQYDMNEDPEPPPVPTMTKGSRSLHRTLTYTEGEENESGHHGNAKINRKRFSSTGDVEKKRTSQRLQRQEVHTRSFKNYLSQFSKKFKTTATHFFLGMDSNQFIPENPGEMTVLEKNNLTRSAPNFPDIPNMTDESFTGFTCYIQMDAADLEEDSPNERPISDSVLTGVNLRVGLSSAKRDLIPSHHSSEICSLLETEAETFENVSNKLREFCSRKDLDSYIFPKANDNIYSTVNKCRKIEAECDDYVYSTVNKVRREENPSPTCDKSRTKCSSVCDSIGSDEVFSAISEPLESGYSSISELLDTVPQCINNSTTSHPSPYAILDANDDRNPTIHTDKDSQPKINGAPDMIHDDKTSTSIDDTVYRSETNHTRNTSARENFRLSEGSKLSCENTKSCVYATLDFGDSASSTSNASLHGSSTSSQEVIYATVDKLRKKHPRRKCCSLCKAVFSRYNR